MPRRRANDHEKLRWLVANRKAEVAASRPRDTVVGIGGKGYAENSAAVKWRSVSTAGITQTVMQAVLTGLLLVVALPSAER